MRSVLFALALILAVPATAAPMEIGNGAQLFVDRALIDSLDNLDLMLHSPVPREVALGFDAPWDGPQVGYATVLQDPTGEYRLYYRGGGDVSTREVTCLALSDDGIHWTRPELGLIEFDGSTANDIVWTGDAPSYGESHNFSPFIDTNPDAVSSERYKAVTLRHGNDENGERRKMLGILGSPDGIHWHRLSEEPVIRQGSFDSLNVAMWDPIAEQYVCYSRTGHNGLRSIQRSLSADFRNWEPPELLEFNPTQNEQCYTNGVTLYPRSPGLWLGFPMRFVPERREVGADHRETDGVSDAVFVTSRDGLHWDRTFREAFIRPGLNPASWGSAHGNQTPATGLLQTAPDELSIYWFENCVDIPRLRRGTLRLDGFASLHSGADTGVMTTVPLVFDGGEMMLNVSTSAMGQVRVAILPADGEPVEGFSLDDCEPIWGDEIERPVAWTSDGNLASLAGAPVRLQFELRDADVYSFTIR